MVDRYETLLGHFRDEEHWLLAPFLQGDIPDFAGMHDTQRLDALSDGERILIRVGLDMYNTRGNVNLRELLQLDKLNRTRVVSALHQWLVPNA